MTSRASEEEKEDSKRNFFATKLPSFLERLEAVVLEEGGHGHTVGNSVSLLSYRTASEETQKDDRELKLQTKKRDNLFK